MNTLRDKLAALILAGAMLLPGGELCAQAGGVDLTPDESKTALEAALARMTAMEEKVDALRSANAALGESLAAANAEADQYRDAYREVRLQMEALGVEAVTPNSEGIEQRLLKAVRDTQLLEEENRELTEQLLRLAGVALTFAQTAVSSDPERLKLLQAEVQSVERRLAEDVAAAPAGADGIASASVVEIADEYGLVVLNAGQSSGARVGMPLEVVRGNETIGAGLVISVRDEISGLMMQRLQSEEVPVQVGDRVRVRTGGTF
ncbi:MAG: hypothetical protein AAF591_17305 [Verrucomicrobiota bacterium]